MNSCALPLLRSVAPPLLQFFDILARDFKNLVGFVIPQLAFAIDLCIWAVHTDLVGFLLHNLFSSGPERYCPLMHYFLAVLFGILFFLQDYTVAAQERKTQACQGTFGLASAQEALVPFAWSAAETHSPHLDLASLQRSCVASAFSASHVDFEGSLALPVAETVEGIGKSSWTTPLSHQVNRPPISNNSLVPHPTGEGTGNRLDATIHPGHKINHGMAINGELMDSEHNPLADLSRPDNARSLIRKEIR